MQLIINADDYALNESCTKAILQAFREGFVSSATIVANGQYFDDAVALAFQYNVQDKIGIHFNLTEGKPLTEPIKYNLNFSKNGIFTGQINRLKPLSEQDKKDVYQELCAQMDRVQSVGIQITHADSHHHIHTGIFIVPIVVWILKEYKIDKIRLQRNLGNISPLKRVIKNLYNHHLQRRGFITTGFLGSYDDIQYGIPRGDIEIMVHPEYDKQDRLIDKAGHMQENRLEDLIKKIHNDNNYNLCSYGDYP